jgi:thiamine kinase-like enzyme
MKIPYSSLAKLPCFASITAIYPLSSGLSAASYKVETTTGNFFAKSLFTNSHANIEIQASIAAAKSELAPQVIYSDSKWLINKFIDGVELKLMSLDLKHKLAIATRLLAQCHQLNINATTIKPLNLLSVINNLLEEVQFNDQITMFIRSFCDQFLPMHKNKQQVFCHGDVNFSNIMATSTADKYYLVDFDSACIACPEYDLAMLLAINCVDKKQLVVAISYYQQQSNININQHLVTRYLCFCHIINGLWYFMQANKQNSDFLTKCAIRQFQLFDRQQLMGGSLAILMR